MITPIDLCLKRARRRLFARTFLNTLLVSAGLGCLLTAVWVEIQPLVAESLPGWHRWAVLGGLLGLSLIISLVRSIRRQPTPQQTALLVDERYSLQERLTTALSLDQSLRSTEPGQAILQDAVGHLKSVKLADKFPVGLETRSWALSIPAALIVAFALFSDPLFGPTAVEAAEKKVAKETADFKGEKVNAPEQKKKKLYVPDLTNRKKSEKLEKLEELAGQLDKLYGEQNAEKKTMTPEKARDAMETAADLQEKLKKLEVEKYEQIKRMQEQMQNLTQRKNNELQDGPGNDAIQALRSGNFEKAQEEFDKLKKKIKDKELTAEEAMQLKRQIEDLAKKSAEMAKKKDEEEKVKKMIDQAKKEGKSTESLERELKKLEEENEKLGAMKEMAKNLNEMKQAMDKNDLEELAEKMGQLADKMGELSEDIKDIEELDDSLEDLKRFRQGLAKKLKNKGEGDQDGEIEVNDDYDGDTAGKGAGRRKINDNAKSSSQDERIRVQFDPKGKKRYAGTTDGPAFTKKSMVELAGEINEAAQEVADSSDIQKLPKAARDSVKEYMERLGNQTPKSAEKK